MKKKRTIREKKEEKSLKQSRKRKSTEDEKYLPVLERPKLRTIKPKGEATAKETSATSLASALTTASPSLPAPTAAPESPRGRRKSPQLSAPSVEISGSFPLVHREHRPITFVPWTCRTGPTAKRGSSSQNVSGESRGSAIP
uniref:Uncharacterized protein n=1 Tax=Magallana gigas TaxID=29159 RepID=K1PN76_MAGGI